MYKTLIYPASGSVQLKIEYQPPATLAGGICNVFRSNYAQVGGDIALDSVASVDAWHDITAQVREAGRGKVRLWLQPGNASGPWRARLHLRASGNDAVITSDWVSGDEGEDIQVTMLFRGQ